MTKFDLTLDSAVFISPFIRDLDNKIFDVINQDFYKDSFDFENVKQKIPYSYTLYSNTDPYVPTETAVEFSEKIDSHLILVRNAGHMGSDFKEFPLVWELCKTRIGFGK